MILNCYNISDSNERLPFGVANSGSVMNGLWLLVNLLSEASDTAVFFIAVISFLRNNSTMDVVGPK